MVREDIDALQVIFDVDGRTKKFIFRCRFSVNIELLHLPPPYSLSLSHGVNHPKTKPQCDLPLSHPAILLSAI